MTTVGNSKCYNANTSVMPQGDWFAGKKLRRGQRPVGIAVTVRRFDGQFDRVTVNNTVFIDGALNVSTIGGFAPTLPGHSFTIVTAGSLSGTFSEIFGTPSATLPGLFWTVTYAPTSAILSTSALAGDIDLDGDVDRTDEALFTPRLGTMFGAIWTSGDFNADGMTTLLDMRLLQEDLGMVAPSAAALPFAGSDAPGASHSVPEPGRSGWLSRRQCCFCYGRAGDVPDIGERDRRDDGVGDVNLQRLGAHYVDREQRRLIGNMISGLR